MVGWSEGMGRALHGVIHQHFGKWKLHVYLPNQVITRMLITRMLQLRRFSKPKYCQVEKFKHITRVNEFGLLLQ